jgi:hypothetical protein
MVVERRESRKRRATAIECMFCGGILLQCQWKMMTELENWKKDKSIKFFRINQHRYILLPEQQIAMTL